VAYVAQAEEDTKTHRKTNSATPLLLDVGARSHLLLQNESSVANSPEVLATSVRLI